MNNYFATSAKIDITPIKNLPLAGLNRLNEPSFNKIDDPLEINGILLNQGQENVVFLSADTLYVTDAIKKKILKTVNKKNNLSEKQLFFGSTHTHYAPFLDKDKPHLGLVDASYEMFFIKSCIQLIDELFTKKMSEVEIIFNQCSTELNINRRRVAWDENYVLNKYFLEVSRKFDSTTLLKVLSILNRWYFKKEMRIFPNPGGIADKNIYSLTIKKKHNSILGIIWSYACHPVSYPRVMNVTSHFPGTARNSIRHKLNQKSLPVVFYQGFSGNIRPNNFEHVKSVKSSILLSLNGHPRFTDFSLNNYNRWINQLNQCFLNTVLSSSEFILNPKIECKNYKIPLSKMLNMRNRKEIYITFQSIKIGKHYCFLGVSGEPAAEYTFLIKKQFPDLKIIPVGCLSGTFGYIPTPEMLKEGGYESSGFLKLFSLKGKFKNDIQDTFLESSSNILNNSKYNTSLQ